MANIVMVSVPSALIGVPDIHKQNIGSILETNSLNCIERSELCEFNEWLSSNITPYLLLGILIDFK